MPSFRALLLFCLLCAPALAAEGVYVPNFWDPQRRLAKPDTTGLRAIRFLTEDDEPPFHFALPDGSLAGFDVEIARAICDELKLPCTVQARRFDTLADALASGQADAVIAGLAATPDLRTKLDFTAPYYKTPARFAARETSALADALPETLAGKTVGVQDGSPHAAFLRAFFARTVLRGFESREALRSALKRGEIDASFEDGISLSFWLNGADSERCCRFVGGPFTESRFFGEGFGIAVRKDAVPLRRALDFALARIAEKGVYTDLYLKYFPLGFW